MADNSSNPDGSSGVMSPLLINEQKNRSKRKFVSDSPEKSPTSSSSPSLTEFPRYEMLSEKFQNASYKLDSEASEETDEDQELEESQNSDWDDPIVSQIEKLLTNYLFEACAKAVKKITAFGYTEEVAKWAIIKSGNFCGSKDSVSNLTSGALSMLKRYQCLSIPDQPVFDEFHKLVDFAVVEMILIIREIRPELTVGEAMYCLLVSDMDLYYACGLEKKGMKQLELKANPSSSNQSGSDKLHDGSGKGPASEGPQAKSKEAVSAHPVAKSESKPDDLASTRKEGSSLALQEAKGKVSGVASGKKAPSSNSRKDMVRHQLGKSCRGPMLKEAFKARVAAWGNLMTEKALQLHTCTSAAAAKEASLKQACSAKKPEPSSSSSSGVSSHPKTYVDYYEGIPYDEALKKYMPQEKRDELLLKLIPLKERLEKDLQSWYDWANEKIMQTAKRLGKDHSELKMLRQEKEEAEKLKRDQQNIKESNLKRLSEMQQAMRNMTTQLHMAHCNFSRLEHDNFELKKQLESANMAVFHSSNNLERAVVREQEGMKKLQSKDKEKCYLQEQLNEAKHKTAELGNKIEKAERRENQFKILLKHEEKEIAKAMAQIKALKQKQEEEDAMMKQEEDNIKQKAEAERLKCIKNIKTLQNMISEMTLESERSKIAALNVGYGNKTNTEDESPYEFSEGFAGFNNNIGAKFKSSRECVMCMSEEISVVLLPCAHQVLCGGCSVLHEKQGMDDCPSCRTTIQRRISVSYCVRD